MSILDTLGSINPFKKKDDFGFPPIDSGPGIEMGHQNLDQPSFDPGQFSARAPPPETHDALDDHRMTMPLGESVRQQRVSAMYGNEGRDPYQEVRENPLQKDLELISSKLDYLKASLDAINQRLVNLEHLAKQEMETKRW